MAVEDACLWNIIFLLRGHFREILTTRYAARPELSPELKLRCRGDKRGSSDAALLAGTSKDLLEAVAAHILQQRYGSYSATSNFPTLLGQVFVTLGLATPMEPASSGEPANKPLERATYELACGINRLRNKEGTGHGRPWLSSVTEGESRMAIESMGVIAKGF